PDVVQVAVVGLSDHRVDRADLLVARLRERPARDGVHGDPDREGVGQDDRRLDVPELADLKEPRRLAEAVADVNGRGDLLLKEIPRVRKDRGHSGAHGFSLDDRLMPDAHAGHVRDRVPLPRRENPGLYTELPDSRTILRECRGGEEKKDEDASSS